MMLVKKKGKKKEGGSKPSKKKKKGGKEEKFPNHPNCRHAESYTHISHTSSFEKWQIEEFFFVFFFETKAKEERKLYDLVHVGWERIGAK